jgi:hypothetical protein
MNQDHIIRQKIMIFMFILSGILLKNPVLSYSNIFLTSLFTILFGVLFSTLYYSIFISPKKLKSAFVKFVFTLIACTIAVIACAVYLFDFTLSVSYINDYYNSLLFMVALALVVIACACFAAYSGYRTISMLCGILVWVVPLFVFATYFSFIEAGYREPVKLLFSFPLKSKFVFDSFKSALFLFSDISVLLYLMYSSKSVTNPKDFKKVYITGISIAIFFLLAETIKCNFLFGTDFLLVIKEPNLAATRLIPGLNVPEIFTVNLSCALLIKLSVYLSAANALIKKYFVRKAKTGPIILLGIATFLLFTFLLHFLPREFTTQNDFFLLILSVLTIFFPILSYINARCHK